MEMKLIHLKIRNFMGCKELDVDFGGKSVKVYGDNGTGKTTLVHAFNWLLFDKNAYAKTDFGIKPYDAENNVIHRLETSVEALFEIDGQPKLFKKVLMESWVRQRGSAEETYRGNENSYYINTVPKKKKEYMEEIAGLIDENVFRMITNPLYFNENIDWKDRREMLLDICGHISDEEVIASDENLAPLLGYLTGRTVAELKSIVTSEMKNINHELGILPARIVEAELAKPTIEEKDTSALKDLEAKLREKEQKKNNILQGGELIRARAEQNNLLAQHKAILEREFNILQMDGYAETREHPRKITDLKHEIESLKAVEFPKIVEELEKNNIRKQQLSDNWDTVSSMQFTGTTCPVCQQDFPEEQLEQKKKAFNVEKATKLDAIEAELEAIKKTDASLKERKASVETRILEAGVEIKSLQSELDAFNRKAEAEMAAFRSKNESDAAVIKEQISAKLDIINSLESNAETLAKSVQDEIDAIVEQITPLRTHIALTKAAERQDARIAELKAEQQVLSSKYSDLERQLFLTEQFIRRKVALINDKVNSKFKFTRFKLFNVQENGGIAETCEATYKGVPYRDLNTAGKLNIGLDIINTLSTHCGVIAPIFLDNVESVTNTFDTVAQRIELIVSKGDSTLRFEMEDK